MQRSLPGWALAVGLTIAGAERKQRDGMTFYDVEGTRPDGSEVELDMLEDKGRFTVVEVQRDIAWADAPAPVRAVAGAAADAEQARPFRQTGQQLRATEQVQQLVARQQAADPRLVAVRLFPDEAAHQSNTLPRRQ